MESTQTLHFVGARPRSSAPAAAGSRRDLPVPEQEVVFGEEDLHAPVHMNTSVSDEEDRYPQVFVTENLLSILGEDLPRRDFTRSTVRVLSQLDTDDVAPPKPPVAFPLSGLVPSVFQLLHEQIWGAPTVSIEDPSTLPSTLVGARKLGKRRISHYIDYYYKFYSHASDPLQPGAAEAGVSLESYAGVKESSLSV